MRDNPIVRFTFGRSVASPRATQPARRAHLVACVGPGAPGGPTLHAHVKRPSHRFWSRDSGNGASPGVRVASRPHRLAPRSPEQSAEPVIRAGEPLDHPLP